MSSRPVINVVARQWFGSCEGLEEAIVLLQAGWPTGKRAGDWLDEGKREREQESALTMRFVRQRSLSSGKKWLMLAVHCLCRLLVNRLRLEKENGSFREQRAWLLLLLP